MYTYWTKCIYVKQTCVYCVCQSGRINLSTSINEVNGLKHNFIINHFIQVENQQIL